MDNKCKIPVKSESLAAIFRNFQEMVADPTRPGFNILPRRGSSRGLCFILLVLRHVHRKCYSTGYH
jgi:hypothetical protein